jgi:hypothetical protein
MTIILPHTIVASLYPKLRYATGPHTPIQPPPPLLDKENGMM